MFALMPEYPKAAAADSVSLEAMRAYSERVNGIRLPEEEVRQTAVFSKEGRFLKDVTPDSIVGRFFGIVEKPAYKSIHCKALAIYANASNAQDIIPFYSILDSANRVKAEQLFAFWTENAKANREQFKHEAANGKIETIAGRHHIFLSHPAETEKAMRSFL